MTGVAARGEREAAPCAGPAQLDPRPAGWFAIAASRDLARAAELRGVLAAAPFVLRRERGGGLSFAGGIGAVAEQNGFVLAWHHPAGQPPEWQVPRLDESGWRPLRHHRPLRVRTHPQETFENSIDLAHFALVHGFSEIDVLQPMRLEGASMSVRYRIARAHPLPLVRRKVRPSFEVRLHGIGCAHNHIDLPDFGLRVRMMVFSTPTEPGWTDIRLAVSVGARAAIPGGRLLLPLVHRGVMRNVVHDFLQDIPIWESKRYVQPPLLTGADGPIGRFRQWCGQFYPHRNPAWQAGEEEH